MKNKILILSTFLLVIPAALLAWGNGGCASGNQYGHMGGAFYGGGVFMGIVSLGLLGVLFFFGIRYLKNNGHLTGSGETPLSILKIRYAKGEITKEQFESMKKDLGI